MLEKQQKKQEEEAEKEQQQQTTTRRTRRRRQESTNDDLDVDEDDEAKDVQQVAKRPCLSQSRRGAFPVQTTSILEKAFNVSSYPSETEITSLCESTRLTDKQVFYFIFFV